MKKRILSLLLTALLLLAILPASVFAADMKITTVTIGGTPVTSLGGNCSHGDIKCVVNTGSGAKFGAAYWQEVTKDDELVKKLGVNDVFEANKFYAFCIWLIPNAGSVFPYTQEAAGDMQPFSGTVSADNAPRYAAKVCTAVGDNYGKLCITIYHGEINSGRIGRVALSVATPAVGTTPCEATTKSAACKVNSTTWSPADPVFRSGKRYTVTIEAEVTGTYEFSNTNFAVNTKPVPVEEQSKKKATIRYTFDALSAPSCKEIKPVTLRVGEHTDLSAQTAASDGDATNVTFQWYRFRDSIDDAELVPGATADKLAVYAEDLGNVSRRYYCCVRAVIDGIITDSMQSGTVNYVTVSPSEATLPFYDVATNSWYYSYVSDCYHNNLMSGVGATSFSPDTVTSRAMIVTILYRMENTPAVSDTSSFHDVKIGEWYTDAVIWAAANGIVDGMSPTVFAPERMITREQFAAIMMRYADYKKIYSADDGAMLTGYPDMKSVSGWAVEAMSWVVGKKLISGMPEDGRDYLNPHGNATRAQAAKIISQFNKLLTGE